MQQCGWHALAVRCALQAWHGRQPSLCPACACIRRREPSDVSPRHRLFSEIEALQALRKAAVAQQHSKTDVAIAPPPRHYGRRNGAARRAWKIPHAMWTLLPSLLQQGDAVHTGPQAGQ